MKCRHGVTGRCARCVGESNAALMARETARLVVELCEAHGIDASRLAELLKAGR